MGCDLCVYVPADSGKDCSMAYSTFNGVRTAIVYLYLKKMGIDDKIKVGKDSEFAHLFGITPVAEFNSVTEALESLGTEEGDSMALFWTHSDCDGSYYHEDCLNIANAIRKVLPMFDEDDENYEKSCAESLADMFQYAGEVEGFVEVL